MKARVITAIVLLPLLLLVLLICPKVVTVVLLGVAAAIAACELLSGTGYLSETRPLVYSCVMAFLVGISSYFDVPAHYVNLIVMLFWVLLLGESMISGLKLAFEKIAVCFVASFVIPYFLGALVRIFQTENGRLLVLVPFILAFMSDTGAYFAGRAFGKHKLAPKISPKKTVEGVLGGVVGAVLGMLIFSWILGYYMNYKVRYLYAVLYGIVGSAAAVFGDLCFSVIKRQTGIKDYGNLIPGHGGVLDRFDSMVVVAPLTEVLMIILPLAVKL